MSKLEQYRALTKQCLQLLNSEEMKTAVRNYTKVIQMGAEKAQRYILNETNKLVGIRPPVGDSKDQDSRQESS